MATLRRRLLNSGVREDAVETIVRHRWARSSAKGMDSAWAQWVRFCRSADLGAERCENPSPSDVVNFLEAARRGEFRRDPGAGAPSHSWLRKLRSTISTMVGMWCEHSSSLGGHPLVRCYLDSLRNEDVRVLDRRAFRYDDTWDVELVFNLLRARGIPTEISTLRAHAVALCRIILACRSSDLCCIHRSTCLRFSTAGQPPSPENVQVRFYRPKERHSLPVGQNGFTRWVTIPAISDPRVCLATYLHRYTQATVSLPREDEALFISERKSAARGRKHFALTAQRLAKLMGATMAAAGVPGDFLPHSARHAGIAFRRSDAGSLAVSLGYQSGVWDDQQLMAHARMNTHTYVTHYLRQIRSP